MVSDFSSSEKWNLRTLDKLAWPITFYLTLTNTYGLELSLPNVKFMYVAAHKTTRILRSTHYFYFYISDTNY